MYLVARTFQSPRDLPHECSLPRRRRKGREEGSSSARRQREASDERRLSVQAKVRSAALVFGDGWMSNQNNKTTKQDVLDILFV